MCLVARILLVWPISLIQAELGLIKQIPMQLFGYLHWFSLARMRFCLVACTKDTGWERFCLVGCMDLRWVTSLFNRVRLPL